MIYPCADMGRGRSPLSTVVMNDFACLLARALFRHIREMAKHEKTRKNAEQLMYQVRTWMV